MRASERENDMRTIYLRSAFFVLALAALFAFGSFVPQPGEAAPATIGAPHRAA